MDSETSTKAKPANKTTSQTLDRGIRVLEALAEAPGPLTVADLASRLEVDRAVIYRLLHPLTEHRLVSRDSTGRVRLGSGLLGLSARLSSDLQLAAAPELASLANDLGATAFITIEDGGDALCLAATEPRHSDVHIAYRPGRRHPLDQGASSVALLSGRPPMLNERPEVARARTAGFAISQGEVQPGAVAVAAPIRPGGGDCIASVAVVALIGAIEADGSVPRVLAAADKIARAVADAG